MRRSDVSCSTSECEFICATFEKVIDETMTKSKSTRRPTCSKCHFHDKVDVAIKGHKQKCRYKNCNCEWCGLLKERQAILSQQTSCIRDARQQKEASEAGLTSGMTFHMPGSASSFSAFPSSSSYGHDLSRNAPYSPMDPYTTSYGTSHNKQSQLPLKPMASPYTTSSSGQTNNHHISHPSPSYTNTSINNFANTSTNFAKISSMCGNDIDSKRNLFQNDLKPYRLPAATQHNSYSELLYVPPSNSASSSPHSHPSTPPSCASSSSPASISGGFLFNSHLPSNENHPEDPHCDRCMNHGVEIPLKGHKAHCPYRVCECHKCMLNIERKHIQDEIRHEKQNEFNETNGYNMLSSVNSYSPLSPHLPMPSAPYTTFYQTSTNQSTLASDFTIPSYLNFRQQDISPCQKPSLLDNKLSEIHYSGYYPQ